VVLRVGLRTIVFRRVTIFREEAIFVLARALRFGAGDRLLEVAVAFTEERRRGAFRFPPELAFFRFTAARFMTDYWVRLGFLFEPRNANSGRGRAFFALDSPANCG
jgi:hypothetical protein